MSYKFFSHNGELLPIDQANTPLSRVEYSYGFGVYESIRVSKGTIFFLQEHCQRLMESAKIIGLEHAFTTNSIETSIKALLDKNQAETCNLKILLIGGRTSDQATIDILCLNPLFPDRKLYKQGASCTTYQYEREFPHAKTLNMLSSYLAYREAAKVGAYDALLINRQGFITEGTRTNFFAIKDKTIISPKEEDILLGVTRDNVLKVAKQNGFEIQQQNLKLEDLADYDDIFLTSTSSKIMPISSINGQDYGPPSRALQDLMTAFGTFLDTHGTKI
ncbi:MAG: aminotransferase class IV [Patescibacteria group bacterium]